MTPLNFAVIGVGNIGRVHLQAIAAIPDARATVVCNRTAAAGHALAAEFGVDWTADFHAAVTRPDVDVVAICTPTGTHMEIAVAAAQAGKHLLVEKPLDVTLARADRIIEVAHKSGVKLACIFPRRLALGVRKAREALAAGRLGRLTLADVYVKWYRPQLYYDGNWRGTWSLDGGGALMNQSIHYVDLIQWLVGPVQDVFAHTLTLSHDMEAEDTASALVRYRNGALGVIQGATSCWPGEPARVELHGDRGAIVLEEGRIVRWTLADAAPDEEAQMLALEAEQSSGAGDPTAIGYEMHRRQIIDLVDAIREDRPPAIQGAEGRPSIEIIRAIYHSAATGQVVALPFDDSGSDRVLQPVAWRTSADLR